MPTVEASSENTRVYECCVLYPHPVTQKELQTAKKAVSTIFAEAGAKEIFVDDWGRRGLAYNIGGFSEGQYVVYYYELEPEKIREIDEELSITPNVLRHLIIKPPKGYEIVSYSEGYEKLMKQKEAEKEAKEQERAERLKQKMLKRQKSKTGSDSKKTSPKKSDDGDDKQLDAEIDKLIADDELEI